MTLGGVILGLTYSILGRVLFDDISMTLTWSFSSSILMSPSNSKYSAVVKVILLVGVYYLGAATSVDSEVVFIGDFIVGVSSSGFSHLDSNAFTRE